MRKRPRDQQRRDLPPVFDRMMPRDTGSRYYPFSKPKARGCPEPRQVKHTRNA